MRIQVPPPAKKDLRRVPLPSAKEKALARSPSFRPRGGPQCPERVRREVPFREATPPGGPPEEGDTPYEKVRRIVGCAVPLILSLALVLKGDIIVVHPGLHRRRNTSCLRVPVLPLDIPDSRCPISPPPKRSWFSPFPEEKLLSSIRVTCHTNTILLQFLLSCAVSFPPETVPHSLPPTTRLLEVSAVSTLT